MREPAEVDHPAEGQEEADQAPAVGNWLIGVGAPGIAADGDAHGACQMAAGRPDRQGGDGEHSAGALKKGGGKLTHPVEGGPLWGGPGRDGDDVHAEPDEPEEPAGEGEVFGDEVGNGDQPGKEDQVDLIEAGERSYPLPLHDSYGPHGHGRKGRDVLGESVEGGQHE